MPGPSASGTVYVVTLGCPKNRVDAEEMCGRLLLDGWGIVDDPDEADVFLVNTCAFISDARDEAAEVIAEAAAWKRRAGGSAARVIVVAGCLPHFDTRTLRERFPEVDLVIGIDDVPRLPELLRDCFDRGALRGIPERLPPAQRLADHSVPRVLTTPPGVAYVRIADGCDHRCAFCTIPSIRGRFRSRTPESVAAECRNLLDMGVRELVFIAQDSSMYGRDLPGRPGLADLLERCDSLDGDFWIRVMYFHPAHVNDRLLDVMAESAHVAPYIDIPIQHISDRVLRRMGRHPGGPGVRRLLYRIRERLPGAAVRTTVITGFPGESEEDFEELLAFVREFRFERLGVFAFSPEPGTRAASFVDEFVPVEVARERRERILEVQQRIAFEKNRALVGDACRVLIEAAHGSHMTGRTQWDAPEIDNDVVIRPGRPGLEGTFQMVRVTNAEPYRLHATLVRERKNRRPAPRRRR